MKIKPIVLLSIIALSLSLAACKNATPSTETTVDSGTNIPDMSDYYLTDNVEKTFEYVDEFNKNSNMEVKLLGEDLLDSDKSHVDSDSVISWTMYEGEVEAYAFKYPARTGKVCWTQIDIGTDSVAVLGIKVGDGEKTILPVMEDYGYQMESSSEEEITYRNSDHSITYYKGDLHITFYLLGDTITNMHIAVYQQTNSKYDDIVIMY